MKEFKLSNINFYTLARDLARNILVPIMAFFIGVFAIDVYSEVIYVPAYTSTMTVSVSTTTQYSRFYDDLSSTIEIAEVLKNVFDSDILKARVEEQTGESFTASVSSNNLPETNFITISVTDKSPMKAYRTLVAVYDNYDKVFQNSVFENTRTNIISPPSVPMAPSNAKIDKAFGEKLGILLAGASAMLILFLSFIRDTVKQPSDVENAIDADLLGVVYHERLKKRRKMIGASKANLLIVSNTDISYGFSEAIKRIAVKITYKLKGKHAKRVLITSVDQHEGKSTVSASIAVQMAKDGANILLIDADLRKPSIPYLFPELEFKKENSLFEYLKGNIDIESIIHRDPIDNVDVISSHSGHMQSAEVLHRGRFKELLDYYEDKYDFIVIDSAPMSLVADTEQIADMADLSVLVLAQDRMSVADINETVDILNASSSEFFGCVLNNVRTLSGFITRDHSVKISEKHGYGKGYGYGYGYGYGGYGNKKK